ncbi:hypothetical protein RvY_15423-1 [Ramazzottius varieornatus]|uniref:Uncharacterized protein n=1 Tax=Ramazzottius varieornatus TaxID=947166 RepID=A0A1D1VUV8_RAMVA|nr:hypothetical protein RvY_15423-1 [Ramazzottius varieornatus]
MGCGYNASCSCGFGKHKPKDGPPPMPMQGGQRMSEQYQSIDAVPIFMDAEEPVTGQPQSVSGAGAPAQIPGPNAQPLPGQGQAGQAPVSGQQPVAGSFPPGDPNAPLGIGAPQANVTNTSGNPQPGQEQAPYNPDQQQPYNPGQQSYKPDNNQQQYNPQQQQYNPQQQ